MKKHFTYLISVVAALLLTALGAKAQEPFPTDGSPISTGTVYSVVMWGEYNATFTPTTTGTLIQDGAPGLGLDSGEKKYVGWGDYGQQYSWQVEAGHTYNIINQGWIFDDGFVKFYMESDQGVTLVHALPEEGEVISPNVNLSGEILLQFNTSVMVDNITVCVGDVEIEVSNTSMLSNTVCVPVKSAMVSLYANGALNEAGGDIITIKIKGLSSESGLLYNGDGLMTLNYVASEKLAYLISDNVPSMLKSYYPAGDTEGIFTFVFDRDILNDGGTYLSISCGNPMSDDLYYEEHILPKIDGATLTFDLTDKVRDLDGYVAMQENHAVAVKLNNVRDLEGRLALGSGQGNVGSYDYSLTYNYIKPQPLVAEFLPASGSSLVGVDEVEIWFNNADMVTFEGVEFNYHTDEGFKSVVVLNSELEMNLENNEMTINVRVPEEVKGHDQITVKLYNMKSLDGYEYRIEGHYDMFVVQLLYPIKDGDTIASTGDEDFVFSINFTDLYFYIRYDFYNAAGPEGWVYGTQLNKEDNGTWTGINLDFPCYNNYKPRLVISAYYTENDYNYGADPAEQYTFTFVGTQAPFAYSDVKFVTIDPEPNTSIEPTEDFCFTVYYDGLVSVDADASGIIMGMGMGVMPFNKVEPVYDSEEYIEGLANTWRLYPEPTYLEDNTSIDISIFAKDEMGKIVEGNLGAGEYDCLQFSYAIASASNNVDLVVVPAADDTVGSIQGFNVSYPGMDVSRNWNYNDNYPQILNWDTFEIAYVFTDDDIELAVADDGTTYIKMTCPEINVKGAYSFAIPEGFFIIGEQFQTYYNNLYFGLYNVTGSSISLDSADPADKAYDVYNMQGIRVISAGDAASLRSLAPGLYIINGKKTYIK